MSLDVQGALRALVGRHEVLRTRFLERGGEVLQAVLPAGHPDAAPRLQKRTLPASSGARDLEALVGELTNQPYPLLGGAPALRLALIRAGPEDAVLFCGMHHIIRRGLLACRRWRWSGQPWHALARPA